MELKDRFAARNEFIKTTAQILGGAFFLFGLYFTWLNLEATKEKNRADLYIAQERQTTDLFTRAIGQLGSDKLEVRRGGIYALERIARESDKDHGPIMEVLTAYVRENAPWPPEPLAEARKKRPWAKPKDQGPSIKPDPDIQAVLTVIGRRARTYLKGEKQVLDLREADLRGADLRQAHLEKAFLYEAHLERAYLEGVDLEGAYLWLAHLEKAFLKDAHLALWSPPEGDHMTH